MGAIITGLNGAIYQDFPHPMYGAWNQMLIGEPPYYYGIGGYQLNIQPRPPGNQYYFPYMGPNVPISIRYDLRPFY
ncbi:hypothetical protein [Niallia nealsonii]|uniref:Uncharacterized protein n=1 Tax=Niallia nealsonii TaxID=115979 RepID=A0A2N0Z3A3_9BACI|nr:hypothetical protein [Niallia nealsonii]PKG23966.1 hypothetical protein CWS01_09360 [Niallia nealsonii]